MKLIHHYGEQLKVYIFIPYPLNKILVEQMISLEFDNIQRRQLGDFNILIVVKALIYWNVLKRKVEEMQWEHPTELEVP